MSRRCTIAKETRTSSPAVRRALGVGKSVALALVFTVLILAWLAWREGIANGPEALDEQAAGLDAGALEGWPFVDGGVEGVAVSTDARVEDGGGTSSEDGGPRGYVMRGGLRLDSAVSGVCRRLG